MINPNRRNSTIRMEDNVTVHDLKVPKLLNRTPLRHRFDLTEDDVECIISKPTTCLKQICFRRPHKTRTMSFIDDTAESSNEEDEEYVDEEEESESEGSASYGS